MMKHARYNKDMDMSMEFGIEMERSIAKDQRTRIYYRIPDSHGYNTKSYVGIFKRSGTALFDIITPDIIFVEKFQTASFYRKWRTSQICPEFYELFGSHEVYRGSVNMCKLVRYALVADYRINERIRINGKAKECIAFEKNRIEHFRIRKQREAEANK